MPHHSSCTSLYEAIGPHFDCSDNNNVPSDSTSGVAFGEGGCTHNTYPTSFLIAPSFKTSKSWLLIKLYIRA